MYSARRIIGRHITMRLMWRALSISPLLEETVEGIPGQEELPQSVVVACGTAPQGELLQGRGIIENELSTDVESPPPRIVCTHEHQS